MSLIKKMIKKLAFSGCFDWMNDEQYLKMLFFAHMDYKLNLKDPKTFNEKLQWLKIHDRNPKYTDLVDKIEAKKIIGELIGHEYIIPTLGVWRKFEDIDFNTLPNSFVLKCSHDSGGVVVCKDKATFKYDEAKDKITKSMKKNYFYSGREWPYKNIVPQIFAEPYIGNTSNVPEDYKFYTFSGVIDSIMVCKERDLGYPKFLFYDTNWNRIRYLKEELSLSAEAPLNLNKMINLVETIAKDYNQVRVDFYNIEGSIYFGELTFYNQSGFDTDITYETDLYWGEKLIIEEEDYQND